MGRHCFIYTEEADDSRATAILWRHFIKIGDNYFQVDGEPSMPTPFRLTGEDTRLRGWKFHALDIIDEKVIRLLDEGKVVYTLLPLDCVEENLEAYR